ncbi:hypothetical protein GCM10022409_41610 [Hymenobacter glaciei]|uniref:Uncharacterized protein n=1 Tax=Hymenobacter glaciei TaxID=877209 RepID=A0ABP7US25_9BACT
MKSPYLPLAALLLAVGSVAAQAPVALQSVQTISLPGRGILGGTVNLPNHNTVLLLTDAASADVTAQCLAPDGRTLWKTTATRMQHATESSYFLDTRQMALGQLAREDKQRRKDRTAAQLFPANVFSDGNSVVLAERLDGDAIKDLPKEQARQLKEGQTNVQRIDEQGHLTQFLFNPRPSPDSKKTEAVAFGRYADAKGYAEVVRETNKREETLVFCTMHYDLQTKTVRREPLELPATPKHITGMTRFRYWYQEWAFLGHRPNQTYFCRRTLVNGPDDKPGKQPITYQVYIVDDQGKQTGGFSTTLGLNPGTIPAYSGQMPNPGELNHIPNYYTVSAGRNSYVTYDEWNTSSGGTGSFYLDHATGEVLIFGEYAEGNLPDLTQTELLGFFERRFSTDGRTVAQMQGPYSDAMRANKKSGSFKGNYNRSTRFHLDPLTGQSQFSFAPLLYFGRSEDFELLMDRDLKPQRYDYLSGKDKDERLYSYVVYAQPFYISSGHGMVDEVRIYEHPGKGDHPVYTAIEKLRRSVGVDAANYRFYLSPTSTDSGLVIEQKDSPGGSLQVYRF